MAQQAHIIGEHITCTLCGGSFPAPVPILGAEPKYRINQIIHLLSSHLRTMHPAETKAMGIMAAKIMHAASGLLMLSPYESNLPEIEAERQKLNVPLEKFVRVSKFLDTTEKKH